MARSSRVRVVSILSVGALASFLSPSLAGSAALASSHKTRLGSRHNVAAEHLLYPIPAPPAQPEPCPPPPLPPGPPGKPLPPPAVPEAKIPVVSAPLPRVVKLSSVSGKGIWLTVWADSVINAVQVVHQAKAAGLHQLWVRTGGSDQGFYGQHVLQSLLPLAHKAGISVIAWDFPTLSNPALDASRAADALRLGVDGFSPDIETAADGTYLTVRRVRYYLSLVRADAGKRPVIATVPRPIPSRMSTYPYAAEAPYVDVFAPMVYWSCNEPGKAVTEALAPLAKLRPVAPIGQSYDMASEGGRHGLPTGQEIWRFLDVSHRLGSIGASLYLYEQTGPVQWRSLSDYPWTKPSDSD